MAELTIVIDGDSRERLCNRAMMVQLLSYEPDAVDLAELVLEMFDD